MKGSGVKAEKESLKRIKIHRKLALPWGSNPAISKAVYSGLCALA